MVECEECRIIRVGVSSVTISTAAPSSRHPNYVSISCAAGEISQIPQLQFKYQIAISNCSNIAILLSLVVVFILFILLLVMLI